MLSRCMNLRVLVQATSLNHHCCPQVLVMNINMLKVIIRKNDNAKRAPNFYNIKSGNENRKKLCKRLEIQKSGNYNPTLPSLHYEDGGGERVGLVASSNCDCNRLVEVFSYQHAPCYFFLSMVFIIHNPLDDGTALMLAFTYSTPCPLSLWIFLALLEAPVFRFYLVGRPLSLRIT